MKCLYCRYENNEDAKVCVKCGADLNEGLQNNIQQSSIQQTNVVETNIQQNQTSHIVPNNNLNTNSTNNKKNNKIIIAVVIVIVIVLGIFVAKNMFNNKNDNQNNNNNNNNNNINSKPNNTTEENKDCDLKANTNSSITFTNSIVSDAESTKDGDFLFPIEDIFNYSGSKEPFNYSGKGTVVSGKVERGTIKVGDKVQIIGMDLETINTTVVGIEVFNKSVESVEAGYNAGILLADVDKDKITFGQTVIKPDSIAAHKRIKADVYVMAKDTRKKDIKITDNYNVLFYLGTKYVQGTLKLTNNQTVADNCKDQEMIIELEKSVTMQKGSNFYIREDNRTGYIAYGVVKEFLD